MICAQADAAGVVSVVNPQPADISTCAMVLASPGELSMFPPMTAAEGGVIASAIAAVWALAFVFRALGSLFNVSGETQNE
jgi:hypothetical protein